MDCQCGHNIDIFPWQWVAQIYLMEKVDDTRLLICLGTIISHHHVLTSKHCFGHTESDKSFTLKQPIKVVLLYNVHSFVS